MSGGRQRGSILAVVAVLLVLFLLAAGLLATRVLAHVRTVRDFQSRNQAFLLAESGIVTASERLRARGVENAPRRLELDGRLDSGSFEATLLRVDIPGAARPERPVYVVHARGVAGGRPAELASRGVLTREGLLLQGLRYGGPPEEWFSPDVIEIPRPPSGGAGRGGTVGPPPGSGR